MISKSKIFDTQASLSFTFSDTIPSYSEDALFIAIFIPKKTFHNFGYLSKNCVRNGIMKRL